jgi:amino acid permease
MSNFKKIIYAVSTLSATIIGVGLFALPYITLKVGIWVMSGYFIVLTFVVLLIHLLFAEVALNTKDYLRMPGYAKIYLGRWGRGISLMSAVVGLTGALLAYLIVGGKFLEQLLAPYFGPSFGGGYEFYVLVYFAVGALLVFWGIKAVSRIEFWALIAFFAVLGLIFWQGWPAVDVSNLFVKRGGIKDFFLPYGAILFALWGASLIPEIEEMLQGAKHLVKRVVSASILISAAVYLVFIFLVLGISGYLTSPEAVAGLKDRLGDGVVFFTIIFGLLTTFTSFITLGLTLKKIFNYDLGFSRGFSWAFACFAPLILFFAGLKDFIKVIGFVGAVMLAVEGILIILMYNKIKKKWLLTLPLILFLVAGIVYEIFYFVN